MGINYGYIPPRFKDKRYPIYSKENPTVLPRYVTHLFGNPPFVSLELEHKGDSRLYNIFSTLPRVSLEFRVSDPIPPSATHFVETQNMWIIGTKLNNQKIQVFSSQASTIEKPIHPGDKIRVDLISYFSDYTIKSLEVKARSSHFNISRKLKFNTEDKFITDRLPVFRLTLPIYDGNTIDPNRIAVDEISLVIPTLWGE